jgi:hypothetical protein
LQFCDSEPSYFALLVKNRLFSVANLSLSMALALRWLRVEIDRQETEMTKLAGMLSEEMTKTQAVADGGTIGEATAAAVERAEGHSQQPLTRWVGSLPLSSHGVMAVIDDNGYLIPLCTAADLLRACKTIWRATDA